MAEPNETAAAPATETPAQPAEAVSGSRPDIRSARDAESLTEKMERLGWEKDKPHTDNPEALGSKARAAAGETAPEEPTEEDTKPDLPKPPAPKPDPKLDAIAEKRAQLTALVKELGLEIEDSRVMPAERVQLRKERREAQQKIAQLEAEAMARIEKGTKALEEKTPQLKKLEDFEAAINSGDHEAVAKYMGFESYDKWQEHVIALKSDPAYQRLRALEQKTAEAERRAREREEALTREETERAQRTATEQQQREQAEARATYVRGLSERMAQSDNPLLKALHDDPNFVGAVFRVQQDHWDGRSNPMDLEQALKTPAKGAKLSLEAELKRLHDKLAPIFGQPQSNPSTVVAAVKAGAVGKQPIAAPVEKKPPRTPQPNKASAITARKETDQDWKRRAAAQLEAAAREDAARMRKSNGAAAKAE